MAILHSGRPDSPATATTLPRVMEHSGSGAGANSAEATEAQPPKPQEHLVIVRSHSTVVALWDSLTIQHMRA
jgi:hypothetical protein